MNSKTLFEKIERYAMDGATIYVNKCRVFLPWKSEEDPDQCSTVNNLVPESWDRFRKALCDTDCSELGEREKLHIWLGLAGGDARETYEDMQAEKALKALKAQRLERKRKWEEWMG